ncbi:hypothetical protein Geu3261_0093_005 [Komagataeibacter europaeus NBRC 3261]|uniref:Uncharacterized protein n=1 Tax=Komagataeibacter europaeus NBRC 3261 TaxID=1234669 RepID=A0A0D6PZK3_KOMEU|nr:hypothetical protein Geu3261_0093_005 [Komagataeibacter europaeus NBRC 3261]
MIDRHGFLRHKSYRSFATGYRQEKTALLMGAAVSAGSGAAGTGVGLLSAGPAYRMSAGQDRSCRGKRLVVAISEATDRQLN